jgi:hypothetical protein
VRLTPVYNLRVAEDHTYFVGEAAWGFSVWVHNAYDVRRAADGTFEVFDEATGNLIQGGFKSEKDAFGRVNTLNRTAEVVAKTREALTNKSLFQPVPLRPTTKTVGGVPGGPKFKMDDFNEIPFAQEALEKGAEVFRCKGGEGVGDFVVIYLGKVYAVELGPAGKTAKQLSKVGEILGNNVEKIAGTLQESLIKIFGN